jgi:phosphoribosylglycinamide formyltransferase-1
MVKLAIFASGAGSNARKILEYFQKSETVKVAIILSNKADAGVLKHAADFGVPSFVFEKEQLQDGSVLKELEHHQIDWIVLAGFLWLMPQHILNEFPDRIINIHPALLPAYGGRGMYGHNVHQSVWQNGESETGITIHFVNNNYDEGRIIMQAKTYLSAEDTPQSIEQKVHALEHAYFAYVIHQTILLNQKNAN